MRVVSGPAAQGGGGWATLEVHDTGAGIPLEEIDHVFEPFFTTKAPEEGTGLGLAVVRRIVENHGGHIGVESVPGHGTVFRAVFPLVGGTPPTQEAAGVGVPAGNPVQLPGLAIWVVDDDQMVRDCIMRGLAHAAAAARAFPNAWAALMALRDGSPPPAMVITDVQMPRLNGLEFARRLHEQLPQVPVVLITAWMEPLTPDALQEAGVVRILYKPFAVSALLQTLAEVVKK